LEELYSAEDFLVPCYIKIGQKSILSYLILDRGLKYLIKELMIHQTPSQM